MSDQELLKQYPSVRIIGYDENPPISSAELGLLAVGLSSETSSGIVSTYNEIAPEKPFVIPESIGKALAAKILGIEDVSDTENNEVSSVNTKPNSLFGDLINEKSRQVEAINVETKSSLKKPGFIRRNAKKIGAIVAASVFAVAAIGGLRSLDKDDESSDKITSKNLSEATTTITQVQPPVINTVPITSAPVSMPETSPFVSTTELPQATEPMPSATVDTQDPSEVVEVIKIQPGRDFWVWNIVQTKLTGSYGGENNSNRNVVGATLRVINAIAYDNGFGNDTSKLSQLSPDFELRISSGTVRLIEEEKKQPGIVN